MPATAYALSQFRWSLRMNRVSGRRPRYLQALGKAWRAYLFMRAA